MIYLRDLVQGKGFAENITQEDVDKERASIASSILHDEPYCWTMEKFCSST